MSAETLLDIFVPPEGMVGHSAVLVAMSGAEDFLEAAAERFTGLRPRQRVELGCIFMHLMLDAHESQSRREVFPPGRIPGLYEFQPRKVNPKSLLHAKIALLAFASNRMGAPIHLRLAVLTANYTFTSALRQLELVWLVDLPLVGITPAEDRADLAAAGAFVETLLEARFHRDEKALWPNKRKLTARLDVLLGAASSLAPSNIRPRFIHSLKTPLYQQIRARFRAVNKQRNLLLCGSGFFEEPSKHGGQPAVFGKLEDIAHFTSTVQRVALVEPDQAGAVAVWAKACKPERWKLVRPFDALELGRRLHAKFILVCNQRDGHFGNGHIYLGSGNLSYRGMLTHGGVAEGNVETGVVFELGERIDGGEITCRLFWLKDANDVPDDEWVVGEAGDQPQDELILEAPPILSAIVETVPIRHLRVLWRDDAGANLRASVSWLGREPVEVKQGDHVALQAREIPVTINVAGDGGRSWVIPVVDPSGRVGWQPLRFDSFADALAALLDFPIRPAEATDEGPGDEVDGEGGTRGKQLGANKQEKNYALHAAAELIEQVAALQVALPASMLDDWLDHLDRLFKSSFPQSLITIWRTHHIDVFLHLRARELRSQHLTVAQLERYFEVLDGAAHTWGLR